MAGSSDDARTDEDLISNMEREIVRLRAELDREREHSERAQIAVRAELVRHRVAGDRVAESTNALLAKLPYFVGNKVAQAEREACVEADNSWRSVRGDAPADGTG